MELDEVVHLPDVYMRDRSICLLSEGPNSLVAVCYEEICSNIWSIHEKGREAGRGA